MIFPGHTNDQWAQRLRIPDTQLRDLYGTRNRILATRLQRTPFFPHRNFYLPKARRDGLNMAQQMCGANDPEALWEIIVFGEGDVLKLFPQKLFLKSVTTVKTFDQAANDAYLGQSE